MKKKQKEIVLQKNPLMPLIEANIKAQKKAKELEEQMSLDFQKWLESERRNTDLSGLMPYCLFCSYSKDYKCTCNPDERLKERLCDKAFRKMQSKLNKDKE